MGESSQIRLKPASSLEAEFEQSTYVSVHDSGFAAFIFGDHPWRHCRDCRRTFFIMSGA
jgi:hypothetical protein